MGGIWGSRESSVESLIEIAGYKAGVVITPEQLLGLLEGHGDLAIKLSPKGPAGFRLHSSEFEDAVVHLLYMLGNTSSPDNISISIELHHKYKNNAKLYPIFN
jgi:restriction system protein